MISREVIQLKNITADVEPVEKDELRRTVSEPEGEAFVVRIKVFNPEDRTMYAYRRQRRILYDNATRKLTLSLHDQHLVEGHPVAEHLSVPPFIALEGKTETEIKLTLPKVINRIRPAAERGTDPNFTEELRISEANEIEVEIAHQDTPFYYNPKVSTVKQLKEWGKAIAKAEFKVKPRKESPDEEPEPKPKPKPKPKDKK